MFKPFIYALVDPHDVGHIRYVGMAMQPRRPKEHARDARRSAKHSHLFHWIRLLQAEGREPDYLVLEELSEDSSRHFVGLIERMYIDSLRRIGHRLTNVAEGGFGGDCGGHSQASRALISAAMTGRVVSDETRARVGEASASRVKTPEWNARIGDTLRGRSVTPEALQNMKDGQAKRYAERGPSPLKGRNHTDETRAKMIASQLARWAKRKADACSKTRVEAFDASCLSSAPPTEQEV